MIVFDKAHNFFHSGVEMDSQQQQFCLKWNSFGSNLANSFSNLFKSESLADVTLFCDGVTFKAHKLILAACSKHLADLFSTAPLHQNLLVILDGTSAANMAALLEFMYKGEVHVAQDSLSSFLKAAECLQVKGLSIEHEKLAVAQSQQHQQQQQQQGADGQQQQPMDTVDSPSGRKHLKVLNKEDLDSSIPLSNSTPSHQQHHHSSSPSPSYSPSPNSNMSAYMHSHYRPYDPQSRSNVPVNSYDKRPIRSPNEIMKESVRASVLRDGSKQTGMPDSPGPHAHPYRTSLPNQPGSDEQSENRYDPDPATALICPKSDSLEKCQDPGCPEDLRMKMEPGAQQDESPSSTAGNNVLSSTSSTNGSIHPPSGYNHEGATAREKEIMQASLWNSVGKLSHKTGTINTPEGKKLKCPFCERLYGYETNLRAHIRQRHQGIRVPCPFCSRTFTRNNTVRRHIAREHKAEISLKAFQGGNPQQVLNHNP